MRKLLQTLSLLFLTILSINNIFAQDNWNYVQQLYFPEADSNVVRPYLCTLSDDGTLWVISTRIQDPSAHNAIYYLPPGDTVFKKFIDYNENGDSDSLVGNIGALRGITSLGNTLYVAATQPYPKTAPNTVSVTYLYPNYDTLQVVQYGFGIQGSGYGSYNHGIDISSDSILFAGISFGTTFRCYNFSDTSTVAAYGSYIPPPQYVMEPGGAQLGGIDLIRDVALIPGGDYNDPSVPFYTSRNSYSSSQQTGGIAKWESGTEFAPINYIPARVEDFDFFLNFIDPYPYGITVDNDEYLWVAGVDSTRRWVKAFDVIVGINALEVYDLPSKFSEDIPDPDGAPMTSPADVSISADGNTAYVIDIWSRSAFKFVKGTVSVDDKLKGVFDYSLEQNYPNPFNPSTMIRFSLPEAKNVKLIVTDVLGNEITTLVDEYVPAGRYTQVFDGKDLSSGIYFYTLITDNNKISKKMILMK